MRRSDVLPQRQRERSTRRPTRRRIEAHARSDIDPLPAAHFLNFALDLLSAFPFACEFYERIPARMGVFVMLVEFVAVMMIEAFRLLVRRLAKAMRECDPALEPVAEPAVLRSLGRELVESASGQLDRAHFS